jgi:hypothetical protein
VRRQILPADLRFLMPGDVLSTFAQGVEHFGLLSDSHHFRLPVSVVSASKLLGYVAEEEVFAFAPSGILFAHGHWGQQHRRLTVKNARRRLGQPYDMFNHNCEQFVRICQGLEPDSPQLNNALGFLFAAGALIALAKLAA